MKRIRCGIIGFGFAGAQHAEAMRRLGSVEVAAICAEDVNKARDKARSWNIPVVYASYRELLNDKSIEVVDIVTPTYLHHRIALAALQEGKHLIVEKPLATKALEAREMLEAAQSSGLVHAVTFNYRFNPLVEQARVMVARGELGPINLVHGHYLQEWLLYDTDYSWRLDPEKSGPAAMVADAGCHWFDLVEYTTGLRVESVLADLSTTIKLRRPRFYSQETFTSGTTADRRAFAETRNVAVTVSDFGAILLRFNNGARGMFTTSSLCAGHKNDLRFEIHGAVASLRWLQEQPNELWLGRRDGATQVLLKDPSLLDAAARRYAALPGGHNEAWPDAFKNLMREIFTSIASGSEPRTDRGNFPTFEDGYHAACISEAIVASSAAGSRWTEVNS